ncbi:MAG: aspartyl-tRNA synthetase [Saprospiraceae bacterium]|jgi:aspartyl-tRNA synthetase
MSQEKSIDQRIEEAGYEVVIGLETHVQLNTKTKLFCSCDNQESTTPNENICAVCTGQMGTLPELNKAAIEKSVVLGKGLSAEINKLVSWDRKHYQYPDLPKNFQLTQLDYPVIVGGEVKCFRDDKSSFVVKLERGHLEEDAGKLVHTDKYSLVDYNRCGTPLVEVVTTPCIHRIADAEVYAKYIQKIARHLGVSDANMEKGQMRSDVSISLRKKGTNDLNPRTEIKNLNSFAFMTKAATEAATKMLKHFEEHGTPSQEQVTAQWDDDAQVTRVMRTKEDAEDYRYIREPDIPWLDISDLAKNTIVDVTYLPSVVEEELIEGGIDAKDAKFFSADKERSRIVIELNKGIEDIKLVATVLMNNIKPEDYVHFTELTSYQALLKEFKNAVIPVNIVKSGFQELFKDIKFDTASFVIANTVSDEQIDAAVAEVIAANPEVVAAVQGGQQGHVGKLMGPTMAKTGKGVSGKVLREKLLAACIIGAEVDNAKKGVTFAGAQTEAIKIDRQNDDRPSVFQNVRIVKDHYRTHRIPEVSNDNLGQEITLGGWIASVRDHGELIFVDLRDASNEVFQVKLTRDFISDLDNYARLKDESVIAVTGKVIERAADDINPNTKTGSIELVATSIDVLNVAKNLPFEIKRADKTAESVRMEYKFLDHRNAATKKAIVNRYKVIKLIRDVLDEKEFIEIETPILSGGTDEGAREFLVPSRVHKGKFYTLPQAPQQYKQMLMVGSFERYFQIARCFRDEDSRGDRQPEFTQMDLEMSFASMDDIIQLNSEMLVKVIKTVYAKSKWQLKPFITITYAESIEKYGCDRPDLRFGLPMKTITSVVADTSFQVFRNPIDAGGIVKSIKVKKEEMGGQRLSKGQIEKLTTLAQSHGLGGLAYIIVNESDLQSPIIKFLGEDIAQNIINTMEAEVGDIVFFSAADKGTANKALDAVRQELGAMLNLIPANVLQPAWVIDFPQFEQKEDGGWTFSHNPFSMPRAEFIDQHMKGEDPGSIIAQQYDIILNGYEIGGGSVRAHRGDILEATFKIMGYNHEEMLASVGNVYNAFQYGAPPHGGIAWGLDRLLMILEKKDSIREVMAYPKTGSGEDYLFNAPSKLSAKKVAEANIKTIEE